MSGRYDTFKTDPPELFFMDPFPYLYSRVRYLIFGAWFIDFMFRFCDIVPQKLLLSACTWIFALFLLKLYTCPQICCCLHRFPALEIQLFALALWLLLFIWEKLLLSDLHSLPCQSPPNNRRSGVRWTNDIIPATMCSCSLNFSEPLTVSSLLRCSYCDTVSSCSKVMNHKLGKCISQTPGGQSEMELFKSTSLCRTLREVTIAWQILTGLTHGKPQSRAEIW